MRNLKGIGLFLFIAACTFNNFKALAQDPKLLKGRILTDSLPPTNIHIVNLSLEKGTTSDMEGNFEIFASIGDSILFSSVQFENRIIKVTSKDFSSEMLTVELYEARNELDEVRISDVRLSGVLQGDLDRIDYFDRTEFGIPFPREQPTQIERKLYTATSSAGGIPLDPLLNALSGRTEMLKKAKANEDLVISVKGALNALGKEMFTAELSLPEEEVVNFLYYCAREPAFIKLLQAEDYLKLIEYCKERVTSFKEIRQID